MNSVRHAAAAALIPKVIFIPAPHAAAAVRSLPNSAHRSASFRVKAFVPTVAAAVKPFQKNVTNVMAAVMSTDELS